MRRRGATRAASASAKMTPPSANHVVRRRRRQRRRREAARQAWRSVHGEGCHSPSRRHCRAVCDGGAPRHVERRAVRVLGRPSRSQRARQLLAEHHHARDRQERPDWSANSPSSGASVIHYNDISPNLRQAILAAEDSGFFEHPGFSISRMVLALMRDIVDARHARRAAAPSRSS